MRILLRHICRVVRPVVTGEKAISASVFRDCEDVVGQLVHVVKQIERNNKCQPQWKGQVSRRSCEHLVLARRPIVVDTPFSPFLLRVVGEGGGSGEGTRVMKGRRRGGEGGEEGGERRNGFGWQATMPFHSALTYSAVGIPLTIQRVSSCPVLCYTRCVSLPSSSSVHPVTHGKVAHITPMTQKKSNPNSPF